MTWWDKLKAVAKREAGAVREELGNAAGALDEALAKKERELAATPAERVDMLLDDIAREDATIEAIEDKLRSRAVERASRAGIEAPVPELPPVRDLTGIAAGIAVAAPQVVLGPGDKTSHIVTLDAELLQELRTEGLDAVVSDLQVDVMVLAASRRDDTIALRTPTLDIPAVTELVATTIADHAPRLAPVIVAPTDEAALDGPADMAAEALDTEDGEAEHTEAEDGDTDAEEPAP